MSEGTQRSLAAIVSADVVGYSRLMGEDAAGTLTALRQLRTEIFAPTVDDHHGRIVKSMGDGWLVEFASVADAVACAIEVQEQLTGNDIIKLRIGVHLGDITHDNEDIYGDGVNIAARLQEIAEPGAMVISDIAWRSIDGKLSAAFADLGGQDLKNIAKPVAAYGWGMTAVDEGRALSPPDKPSIAVLPFENMSGDPEQEYFSDGVAEDILTELCRLPMLMVIARNSSFTYKGQSVDIKQVGRELSARYVLEGSIRRAAGRVRVSAQLIEANSGAHIWAEHYDRDLEDIFSVQDEITLSIASALIPEIIENEQIQARRVPPNSLSSQDLVWQGMWHSSQFTPEAFARGRELIKAAVELEPNHAVAHAWLAYIAANAMLMGWHDSPAEACQEALTHANRALELERNCPEAHLSMAATLIAMRQWDQAFMFCKTALRLTPSFSFGYFILGSCDLLAGDARTGVENLHKAMQLSPRDIFHFYFANQLALAHYKLGEYEDTVEWAQKSIHAKPDFVFPNFNLAAALGQQSRHEEAEAALNQAYQLVPEPNREFFMMGWPFKDPADLEHLLDGLRKAGLPG